MKVCKKCNSNKNIEEHHIQPKFMDNKKGYGLLIDFCKKHHHILHLIIPCIIWKHINQKDRLKIIKEVENFTFKYCENNIDKEIKDFIKEIEDRRCKKCDRELDEEDILKNWCPYCNNSIDDGNLNVKHN